MEKGFKLRKTKDGFEILKLYSINYINLSLYLRIENLYVDPVSADLFEGRSWYNSSEKVIKFYDGTNINIIPKIF